MNDQESPWQYKPDGQTASQPTDPSPAARPGPAAAERAADDKTVSWSASEYIDHTHGAGWYLSLVTGTMALAAIVYFMTKDYFAVGIIVFMGLIMGAFSTHKPKQVTYELSASGVKAGEKKYPYSLFKSFTIIRENALCSLNLMPTKRFMPPVSIYFDPTQQQKIIDVLASHLAYEEGGLDIVERISRRLRL